MSRVRTGNRSALRHRGKLSPFERNGACCRTDNFHSDAVSTKRTFSGSKSENPTDQTPLGLAFGEFFCYTVNNLA